MKRYRLTESRLRNMIREAVKVTLNEGKLGTSYQNLENARELLGDIMNSGFIPFSSPSPSSTEVELKNAIIDAAREIDHALYLCGKLGYNMPPFQIV